MTIKISKGEVRLKEKLTVRDHYRLQCEEQGTMRMTDKGVELDGDAINKLKEYKVLMAIEKIIIDEKERDIRIETLLSDDYMTIDDFDKVFNKALDHIVKLQKKAEPSKKS